MQQLLTGAALIALLGVGETLVIVTRNVDLSVGSVVGLSAYVIGITFKNHPHMPVLLGFLLGIGIGAAVGAILFQLIIAATQVRVRVIRSVDEFRVHTHREPADDVGDAFAIGDCHSPTVASRHQGTVKLPR